MGRSGIDPTRTEMFPDRHITDQGRRPAKEDKVSASTNKPKIEHLAALAIAAALATSVAVPARAQDGRAGAAKTYPTYQKGVRGYAQSPSAQVPRPSARDPAGCRIPTEIWDTRGYGFPGPC